MSKLTVCKECGYSGDDGRFMPHVWHCSQLANDGECIYENYCVRCENCGHINKTGAKTPEEAIEIWRKQN